MNKVYCPVNGCDCPYYQKDGSCELGKYAMYECDDYASLMGPIEEED